jgi:5-methylcytosine-specific restriction endonuclease McrA
MTPVVTSLGKRSRYVPAAERRQVYQRDAGRCTYVDARGERCCETRYLEIHHLRPFAKQGPHVASNLTLRCAAHNALAAEEEFDARRLEQRRESTRHEALARQLLVSDPAD